MIDIHAVRIDLSMGQVGMRASRDAPGTERGVGTDTFAANVGALVAIGGDWSDGSNPVGLAIGNGFPELGGRNVSSKHWDFICDMRTDSEILVDGEVFYKDGQFLV